MKTPARELVLGEVFNNLTILKKTPDREGRTGDRRVLVKCSCGSESFDTSFYSVYTGRATSCGCLQRKGEWRKRHNSCYSPTYKTWEMMIQRCHNPKHTAYKNYGALGVVVCDRWREDFKNFLEDMGERPEGMTLNRIHCAPLYSKSTCEWATNSKQAYEKRKLARNTSGRTGVSQDQLGRWRAYIGFKGRNISLGTFDVFQEAAAARAAAELKYYGEIKLEALQPRGGHNAL